MNAGDLVIWNNNRVLHGRAAFDGRQEEDTRGSLDRHLVGGYVDWDDVLSKRRVLRSRRDKL